jgi:hypothetical protein
MINLLFSGGHRFDQGAVVSLPLRHQAVAFVGDIIGLTGYFTDCTHCRHSILMVVVEIAPGQRVKA